VVAAGCERPAGAAGAAGWLAGLGCGDDAEPPQRSWAWPFAALAGYQFRTVAAGLAPASADDLADAVRTVFQRSDSMENVVRWTLAATDPQRVPRPNVQAPSGHDPHRARRPGRQ
jgi:hypothetical protein